MITIKAPYKNLFSLSPTLMNMQLWIDAADRPDFSHQDN